MAKTQQEIHEVESLAWKPVEGSPGVYEKILNRDPETNSVTRLLRYDPGFVVNEIFKHDFFEEVYIVSGSMIDLRKNLTLKAGYYGYRHPGMEHGPYSSPEGIVTLEIRTYEK